MKPCPKCSEPVAQRGMVVEFLRTYQENQEVLCQHPTHAAAQAVVEAAQALERMAGHRVGCAGASGGPCSCPKGTMRTALAAMAAALEKPK